MDDRKAERRRQRMEKAQARLDPKKVRQASALFDAYGGPTGQLREAERDYQGLRQQARLIELQEETNDLLRQLLDRG